MLSPIIAIFISFTTTAVILKFRHLHDHLTSDSDFSSPQKIHLMAVPRIGGISVLFGLIAAFITNYINDPSSSKVEILLLISLIPTFAIGLCEDITKNISIRMRLIFTAVSALIAIVILDINISRVDIPFIDSVLITPYLSIPLTIFAITGLTNSYNIIDGFNGLATVIGICNLLAIAYLALIMDDIVLMYLCLNFIGGLIGFLLWNYPKGLVFLGDGGAYVLGFWLAIISILLIQRHQDISAWFVILVNVYPILETLFTIFRRKIYRRRSPGQPDGIHFHTLIYRRVLSKKKIKYLHTESEC